MTANPCKCVLRTRTIPGGPVPNGTIDGVTLVASDAQLHDVDTSRCPVHREQVNGVYKWGKR